MQKEAKEKIQKLIDKYEEVKTSGKLRSYSEEETKRGFIEPLFEILGWDISNKKEVSLEETISSKRVDYGFYLNERVKFYLEAKKFNVDLYSEDFANQAIRYSFNKGATWAVLTNFETLIVFNAQDISKNLSDKRFFTIDYNEYLEKFDQLCLLSKESFEKDLLDREADKYGKKIERVPISSLLYKDLQKCREILIKDLSKWNKNVNSDDLDEGVQKILDRLLFIRVAEDREVEPATLRPLVREYYGRKEQKGTLYEMMIKKFRELDAFYNSNLFSKHPFEDWEEFSGATAKVINILYGKEGYYEYDFKVMPSDVLGAVYENYLSHRLSKSKKGTTVSKDANKRKEQGIYYTPSYIVDYIVKNALGPVLDKCRSIGDIKKIKVLDPACGSGSFLIKVLEIIYEKYESLGATGNEEFIKIQILEENIYGVDLDQQAVEITRLNLLINSLTEKMLLPHLKNIKNGNSLISGTDEELEKYFGKNFMDKKPFNWQEEFPEVFKQGGFDVIIGNPPYVSVKGISTDDKRYFSELFETGKGRFNLFTLFLEKGQKLLKNDGMLSYILPEVLYTNSEYKYIRKYLLEKTQILSISNFSSRVFDASVDTSIIVIKNRHNKESKIKVLLDLDSFITEIKQSEINDIILTRNSNNIKSILDKINSGKDRLSDIIEVQQGIIYSGQKKENVFSNEKLSDTYKKILDGRDIHKYLINYDIKQENRYIKYTKELHRPREERLFLAKEKLIFPRRSTSFVGTIDTDQFYLLNTAYICLLKNPQYSLKYILGLLNSRVIGFLYSNTYIGYQITIPAINSIPIPKVDKGKQKQIIVLVNKMLELNKELPKITENTEKWNSIKSEIEKTDKKIDQEVYELYGLTEEEIKIIEK